MSDLKKISVGNLKNNLVIFLSQCNIFWPHIILGIGGVTYQNFYENISTFINHVDKKTLNKQYVSKLKRNKHSENVFGTF